MLICQSHSPSKGRRRGTVGVEESTGCIVAGRHEPTSARHSEPRRMSGLWWIILRTAGRERYSQNYLIRIALCAARTVRQTEMMPFRIAYWTSSAVVLTPSTFMTRAL